MDNNTADKKIIIAGFFRASCGISNFDGQPYSVYTFNSNKIISEEKFEPIKILIETYLNGDTLVPEPTLKRHLIVTDEIKDILSSGKYGQVSTGFSENNPEWFKPKKEEDKRFNMKDYLSFTKEQLNGMMENVWDAARLAHPLAEMKYDTFKDYYNSLPENKLEDKQLNITPYPPFIPTERTDSFKNGSITGVVVPKPEDNILQKEPHIDENDYTSMIYQRNVQNPYSKESQSGTAYEKGFEECWNYFFKSKAKQTKQMYNSHIGIHDEDKTCRHGKCEEYNPLDKNHSIK